MYWAVGAWIMILGLSLLYSAKFSYRSPLDRPLMFPQIVVMLRFAGLLLLAVVIFLALRRHVYLFGGAAVTTSFLLPHLIRRHAYNREMRRLADLQVEGNRMEWQQALEVAKFMLDMDIRDGRRTG